MKREVNNNKIMENMSIYSLIMIKIHFTFKTIQKVYNTEQNVIIKDF